MRHFSVGIPGKGGAKKLFIIIAAVAAVIPAASAAKNKNSGFAPHAAVCSRGGETVITFGNKEFTVKDDSAGGFNYNAAAQTLYYTVGSSFSSGTFDLYRVSADSKAPSLVDYGIDGDYYLSKNGAEIFYTKNDKSIGNSCAYHCQPGAEPAVFAKNVSEIFYDGENGVWFTRSRGSGKALFHFNLISGEQKELSAELKFARLFCSGGGNELVFGTGNEDEDLFALNIVYPGERPVLVSGNVIRAELDSYRAGGNLYFFTPTCDNSPWKQVVSDYSAQADSVMAEPDKNDYISFFGSSPGYEHDKSEYEQKLKRDKLRAALDREFIQSGISAPIYDVFVYNKNGAALLESGVDPNMAEAESAGEPKFVFKASEIQKKVDLTELVEAFDSGGTGAAFKKLRESYETENAPQKVYVSVLYGGAATRYPLEACPENCTFVFSQNGNILIAAANSPGSADIYCAVFDKDLVPGVFQKTDSGIKSYSVNGEELLYLKSGTVIHSKNGVKTELSTSADAFIARGEGKAYCFKKAKSADKSFGEDMFFCSNGGEKVVLKGVNLNSAATGFDGTTAILKKENNSSSLYICSETEKKKFCGDVDKLLYYF